MDYFVPTVKEVVYFSLWLLCGAVISNLVALIAVIFDPSFAVSAPMQVICTPLLYIPALLYASSKSRRNRMFADWEAEAPCPVDSLKKSQLNTAFLFVIGIVMVLSAQLLCDGFTRWLPEISPMMKEQMEALMKNADMLSLITLTCVLAPIFEETVFRGIVCRGIAKNYGPVWGIMVSAVFFGAIHLNVTQAVPAFVLGVVFGYVYLRTGSLKLTMAMHCANNAFAVYTSRFCPELEGFDSLADVLPTAQYIILVSAAFVLLMIGINIIRKNFAA